MPRALPQQFVPLPLWIFEALPVLTGTEIAVLLVVARATLGWQEGAGRKERDWISHRQFAARTGRGSTALTKALDALVLRGLLIVADKESRPLETRAKRRSHRGRIYYRLPSRAGSAMPKPMEAQRSVATSNTPESYPQNGNDDLKSADQSNQLTLMPLSDFVPHTCDLKAGTTRESKTKEKQTKEKWDVVPKSSGNGMETREFEQKETNEKSGTLLTISASCLESGNRIEFGAQALA